MAINRRSFIKLLAPSLALSSLPFPVDADDAKDAVFIVIDGFDPTIPAEYLRAFIETFLEIGVPIGLIPNSNLASETKKTTAYGFRRIFAENPDMVEPVLWLPGLKELPSYFQRRAASDAIKQMSGLLEGFDGVTRHGPVTIATDASTPSNYDGLRCLGIRNVLSLFPSPSVSSTGCAQRTVCLYGSKQLMIVDVADPAPWIEEVFAEAGWRQIVFSLAGIGQISMQDLRLRAQRVSDAIGRELSLGRRFVVLPREHARWFGADQLRFVAVRIESGTDVSSAAMAAFMDELEALEIPVTDTRPSDLESEIDLLLLPDASAAFDGGGRFIRGDTTISQAASLLANGNLMRDAVVAIGPQDYGTLHARQATLDTLGRFRQDPGTRLVDVTDFFTATTAPDPVFDLLRETRRDIIGDSDPQALTGDELLADARQAWAYFERFSIPATGLCVDTADVQAGYSWLHRELTMWDLGSLFAAVMAAHEIGLISDDDFVARSELLIKALPVVPIGELLLPSEVISADTGASLSRNFNACDTGRLLSVLRELDAYPLTQGVAVEKVAQWDLDGVVIGGHVHSVINGRPVDRFRSQCAHYTARAFRARGIAADSPYEVEDAVSKTDRDMQTLLALAGLDPLGAEPLLLEALEAGLSEPSRLLAEVLFSAQRREYERSGRLICMSEAPINREPWFTYQGLNVTASEERWRVNVTSSDPRFATPEFRRAIMLVNTKAAYLWDATRPSSYSSLLVRHVRDRTRLEGIGFSPGVFVATGKGMPGYSDINTNAIVLEAISFITRGRKPRLNL